MNNILQLLPGEHLGASVARLHYLAAGGALGHTMSRLGVSKHRFRPHRLFDEDDFSLSQLYESNGASDVWHQHAMGSYATVFLKRDERTQVDEARLRGGPLLNVFGKHTVLPCCWRWCVNCTEEDEAQFGITYYHRDHQLPGVFHCDKHHMALTDGCQECGFTVELLMHQNVPPVDNLCPHCGKWMGVVDGYFSEKMAKVESRSLVLARHSQAIGYYEDYLKRIREHAGLNPTPINNMSERKRLTSWLDDLGSYFPPEMLAAYFPNINVSQSNRASNFLRNPRLFDPNTPRPPLHPLVHILTEIFVQQDSCISEREFTELCHE